MVTGVETAGLVLAAFPLVVDGLGHYINGLQTIRYWRRYRLELTNYARKLKTQRVRYSNTLELLFDGIVESDEELAALIKDPVGIAWRKEKYSKALEQRLDHSYENFLDTLQNMTETLESMGAKLGIDYSGKVVWDNKSSVEREMKRLEFVLFRGAYNEMLNSIDGANKDLREFTHEYKYLEPIRRDRRSKRPYENFKSIRSQAKSLYDVVVTGGSWSCWCKNYHTASLRLEPRPRRLDDPEITTARQLKFRILLSKGHMNNGARVGCEWQELEVLPMEIDIGVSENSQSTSIPVSSIGSDQQRSEKFATATAPRNRLKKHTRFVSPIRHSEPMQQAPFTRALTEVTIDPISDICATVYQSEIHERNLGFLADDGVGKHQHRLYLPADAKRRSDMCTESLEGLLRGPQQRPDRLTFVRRDRLYIALTLASSVLQLDKTAWLKSRWSSRDIFFHYESGTSIISRSMFNHPYLFWKLCSAETESHLCTQDTSQNYLVRSETLLALGLTLVELCFGKTLAEMWEPEDHDANDTISRLKSANRLLDKVYEESGCRYGDVVRRCLDCPFDFRDLSFENDEFQRAIFDGIVVPLATDLDAFDGALPSPPLVR